MPSSRYLPDLLALDLSLDALEDEPGGKYGDELNAIDEELVLDLEREVNELRASLRCLLGLVRVLLPQARSIEPSQWGDVNYRRACTLLGEKP